MSGQSFLSQPETLTVTHDQPEKEVVVAVAADKILLKKIDDE